MIRIFNILFCFIFFPSFGQEKFPHLQAHAHNDYEHIKPLWNALENGFISVEADVHLKDGKLLVSHGPPSHNTYTLSQLYLSPLDSLLKQNSNSIYPGFQGTFYLMIDSKTEAENTYRAIQSEVELYKSLLCNATRCPVKIIISGNRALSIMMNSKFQGLALDGRPGDLGKNISSELMPVISDHYSNWSSWNGKLIPVPDDLSRIKELAQRVHGEGKKLRLWAIPDNEIAWAALLASGVDFINSDRLAELHYYLSSNGL